MAEQEPATRRAVRSATVVALATARRTARSAGLWGALFALLVANEALTYHSTFPTMASRRAFAATFGSNAALSAIVGPGHRLDTVDGVVAWRVFGLMIIVAAIWGLLTATRLLRGEEDAGRWEILLAGHTSRRHAAVQAVLGLAAGWALMWALVALAVIVAGSRVDVGFPVSASLFYATASTASGALFLAVGALTSQLTDTRRQATGWAAAVFAVCYLIRLVADSRTSLGWLRWASPLGWIENSRPLTGSRPLPLLLVAALTAGLVAATVATARHRDVGAGALTRRRPGSHENALSRSLDQPMGLAWRLERWVVLTWILGLGVLALVFGVVAGTADQAGFASNVDETVSKLGGAGSGAEAWIGYLFLYLSAILAFAAAGQVSALRTEEAAGHLDHLLARSVSRSGWLGGRLAVGVVLVAGSSLAAAVGGWAGVRDQGIGFPAMMRAGLNLAVPGLFVLGLGTLLFGLVPRWSVPLLYVPVLWSFVVEIFGTSITDNRWLLDTALLTHLGPVPAARVHWDALLTLCALAVLAGSAGFVAFVRRDLANA